METLRESLESLLGGAYLARKGVFVLQYGSRLSGRDRDIVVVQPEVPPSPSSTIGDMDIMVICQQRMESLIEVLDPIVTEPILTGDLVVGDERAWKSMKTRLGATSVNQQCLNHPAKRSLHEYLNATGFLERHSTKRINEFLVWALEDLAYSISFGSFLRHYALSNGRACTLESLIESGIVFLPEFWTARSQWKNRGLADRDVVEHWLEQWRNTLFQTTFWMRKSNNEPVGPVG